MGESRKWFTRLTGGAVGGRNLVALAFGQVVFAASFWGILSALARLGGAEDVGKLAFALAVVTPAFALAKLRLRSVVATDVVDERPMTDYLLGAVFGSVVATLASLFVAGSIADQESVLPVVAAMAIARSFETLSQISYGYQQRQDQMTSVGISVAVRGLLSLLFLAVVYAQTRNVAWAAVAMAVAHGLLFVSYDWQRMRAAMDFRGVLSRASLLRVWNLVVVTLPLGMFAFLVSLTDNIPRLILSAEHGLAELGVFATFGYVVTGSTAINRALDEAASPRIARAVALRDPDLLRKRVGGMISMACLLGLTALVLAFFFGEPFLDLVFGPEFAAFSTEFTLMALYAWMLFAFAGLTVTLIAARRFKTQLTIQLLAMGTVVLMSVLLVPDYGILGAVISVLGGGVVRLALTGVTVGRIVKELRVVDARSR